MDDPCCPETGTPMERGIQTLTLNYKGRSLKFEMPGWYCPECGEGIHSGLDMKLSDRALNRLKAEAEGLLSPEEIRRVRKKLRLTQADAGQLIGGGPRAFQKYEAGDLLLSRGINSALVLLESEPESLNLLRERDSGRDKTDELPKSNVMAKNTGQGHRVGAVRGRSQSVNPKTGLSTKRDASAGRSIDVKTTGGSFKGVRKEK